MKLHEVHSSWKRIALTFITLLTLIASPLRSDAEQSEFLLEGDGDSGITDYSLIIVVTKGFARIAVKGQGCLGSMDANLSRINRLTWVLSSVGDGEACEIILKDHKNGEVEAIQGPGCSYYHGAVCGFSGKFKAPTKNGLAPLFDPKG